MTVKIRFQWQILAVLAVIFSTSNILFAQDTILNKYGLWVIKDAGTLNSTTRADSNKLMVDIKKLIPNIIFDLRYATTNNFMHRKLYPTVTTAFIRLAAAKALQRVQTELNILGLGLKIFDAYRPYSVTEKMWQPIKDERYVADPKKGSGHNRGIAVDLTLVNLKTKQELLMGTGFDNFSDTAHQNFTALPQEILQNRNMLKRLMEKYGFKPLETEWWHYSLPNAKDFELLDVNFKKLKKITASQRH
ncbi:MAG: peptidase [Chitinophagaceae bacterium]|nr:peptidase [Chitinophagaceae bacterium]